MDTIRANEYICSNLTTITELKGERWVWWTLALGGLPGFSAAVGIHFAVGYLDLWHLFPALLALFLFAIGLALSGPYLLRRE